jgi:hypothetical protein
VPTKLTFLLLVIMTSVVATPSAFSDSSTRKLCIIAPPHSLPVPLCRAEIAFGRFGGTIHPYTVTIMSNGSVTAVGIGVGRKMLTPLVIRRLEAIARSLGFFGWPPATDCERKVPDIGWSWIGIAAKGTTKTVREHGNCIAGFHTLYAALSAAVQLA